MNMSPAAGWYRDPANDAQARYWDGEHWTNETRRIRRDSHLAASATRLAEDPASRSNPLHVSHVGKSAGDELFAKTTSIADDQLVQLISESLAQDEQYNEDGLCASCEMYTSPYIGACSYCGATRHVLYPHARSRWSGIRSIVNQRGLTGHHGVVRIAASGFPLTREATEAPAAFPILNRVKVTDLDLGDCEISVSVGGVAISKGKVIIANLQPHQILCVGISGGTKLHGGNTIGVITDSYISTAQTPIQMENNYIVDCGYSTESGAEAHIRLQTRKSLWSGDANGPWDFVQWVDALKKWLPRAVRRSEDAIGVERTVAEAGVSDYLTKRRVDASKACASCGATVTASAKRCVYCLQSIE